MENTIIHFKEQFQEHYITHYHDYCDIDSRKTKKVSWAYLKKEKVDTDILIKNYGNLLKKIESNKLTIVIEETDLRISFKIYQTKRIRVAGNRFFIVRKTFKGITYNKKSKNFYIIENYRKDKKILSSKIRTNYFTINALRMINNFIVNSKKIFQITVKPNIESAPYRFLEAIYNSQGKKHDEYLSMDESLFKFYLDVNNIKYPNTFYQFRHLKLTKQKLKKIGNLVKYFIKEYNLKGNYIVKLLNTNENIDFYHLIILYHNLGVDYFNKLNPNIFTEDFIVHSTGVYDYKKFIFNLTNADKRRIVNFLNVKNDPNLILSHLMMIRDLQEEYGEKWKMKFNDVNSFDNEHYNLSETIQSYKKGFVTRDYGEKFKEEVQTPIYGVDGVDYFPCLLLNTDDYNEESVVQHNCVRTYSEKPSCFIISLRLGETNGGTRVTIEYQIRKNAIYRVQTRTKHNKVIDGQLWDIPISILDERINLLYKNKIFSLPTITIQHKNKPTKIKTAIFNPENLIPIWDDQMEEENILNELIELDFF